MTITNNFFRLVLCLTEATLDVLLVRLVFILG